MINAIPLETPQKALDLASAMGLQPLENGALSSKTGALTVVTGYAALFLFELGDGSLGAIDGGWDFEDTNYTLRRMGIDPSAIATILLTHAHEDHVGLLQGEGSTTEHYIGWHDRDVLSGRKPSQGAMQLQRDIEMGKHMAQVVSPNSKTLTPFVELELGEDVTVLPIPVPGHTDGSYMFDLSIRGKSALHVGDTFAFGSEGQIKPTPEFLSEDAVRNETEIASTIAEYLREHPDREVVPSHSGPRSARHFLSELPNFRPDPVA